MCPVLDISALCLYPGATLSGIIGYVFQLLKSSYLLDWQAVGSLGTISVPAANRASPLVHLVHRPLFRMPPNDAC